MENEDIVFVSAGGKLGKYVSFNSSGDVFFTADNVKDAGIGKVEQFLCGYNAKTCELVLKPCDAEEYGSVMAKKTANNGRSIGMAHLKKRFNIPSGRFSFRKEKGLIVLKREE